MWGSLELVVSCAYGSASHQGRESYLVFHASWAALTFRRAVSAVKGGMGAFGGSDMVVVGMVGVCNEAILEILALT